MDISSIVKFIVSSVDWGKVFLYLLYAILGGLGSFVGWVVIAYNSLVNVRRRADEALANVKTQLKRRYDLIPNLVESVRAYATHEKEVFEKVTEARTRAMNAGTAAEEAQAENVFTGALKSLFAVAENYPQLRASENFMELQRALADAEDKIQEARRAYNEAARELNVKAESVPLNFVATFFRFKKADFFDIAEAEKEAPKVKF
ncbi:MAG: LemA family protein [Patescibacteria group bacterium]